MDENLLSGLEIRPIDQCLPRGQADQRYRSRRLHGEFSRLESHIVFPHCDEFREGDDSSSVRPRLQLVAGLEIPHIIPNLDDHKVDIGRYVSTG